MAKQHGTVCLLVQDTYRPGDLPPDGYLAWHEWADVQRKAGIKQVECGVCGLWRTPQELSDQWARIEYSDDTADRLARDGEAD